MSDIADTMKTQRDFERLLQARGFSRSRAKAIASKGFAAVGANVAAELIEDLAERRRALQLEEKANGVLQISANHVWPRRWQRLGVISPNKPSSFRITATSLNPRRLQGQFRVKVRYRGRSGRREEDNWLSHGGAGANGPYFVNAGMQSIKVKAMAPNTPQHLMIRLVT